MSISIRCTEYGWTCHSRLQFQLLLLTNLQHVWKKPVSSGGQTIWKHQHNLSGLKACCVAVDSFFWRHITFSQRKTQISQKPEKWGSQRPPGFFPCMYVLQSHCLVVLVEYLSYLVDGHTVLRPDAHLPDNTAVPSVIIIINMKRRQKIIFLADMHVRKWGWGSTPCRAKVGEKPKVNRPKTLLF